MTKKLSVVIEGKLSERDADKQQQWLYDNFKGMGWGYPYNLTPKQRKKWDAGRFSLTTKKYEKFLDKHYKKSAETYVKKWKKLHP